MRGKPKETEASPSLEVSVTSEVFNFLPWHVPLSSSKPRAKIQPGTLDPDYLGSDQALSHPHLKVGKLKPRGEN